MNPQQPVDEREAEQIEIRRIIIVRPLPRSLST